MKRSPLWFAAYVAAWRTLRDAARFVERREGERTLYDRVPLTVIRRRSVRSKTAVCADGHYLCGECALLEMREPLTDITGCDV